MSTADLLGRIVAMLDEVGICHMVAGSVASSHHGEPRSTQDIDLVIDPVRRQVQLLVAHVNAAGLYVNDALAAFDRRDQFNIIDTVIGFKADLIVRKDRPFSASEFERREPVKLLGVETAVATVEDTILAKLEWWTIGGSDRQLRDVDAMIRAHRGGLDLSYLIRWGAELGVSDQLGVMLET